METTLKGADGFQCLFRKTQTVFGLRNRPCWISSNTDSLHSLEVNSLNTVSSHPLGPISTYTCIPTDCPQRPLRPTPTRVTTRVRCPRICPLRPGARAARWPCSRSCLARSPWLCALASVFGSCALNTRGSRRRSRLHNSAGAARVDRTAGG